MKESVVYDCRWSDELDGKFIADFLHVCSTVFNYDFTEQEFKRKFIDNIYGPSVLVVVYIDGQPCAARALWRNDIGGKEAYQPGDTCVLEVCRGKGIFPEMTRRAIDMIPKEALIYNFPNQNSYNGYLKMGWKLVHDYHLKLLLSYKQFKNEHPYVMDDEYVNWWLKGRDISCIKIFGHYFLVANKPIRPFCFRIIAEVSKNSAQKFHRKKSGVFFYFSQQITWYNKRFAANHVVSKMSDISYIPTWKIDAI